MRICNRKHRNSCSQLRFEPLEWRRMLSADLIGPSVSIDVGFGDDSPPSELSDSPDGPVVIDNLNASWHELDGTHWVSDSALALPSHTNGSSLEFSLTRTANVGVESSFELATESSSTIEVDLSEQSGVARPTIDIGMNRISRIEDSNPDVGALYPSRGASKSDAFMDDRSEFNSPSIYQIDGDVVDQSLDPKQRLALGELNDPESSPNSFESLEAATSPRNLSGFSLTPASDSIHDRQPTDLPGELDAGLALGGSLIASTFAVAPNRGLAESSTIEPRSPELAPPLIDISINKSDTNRQSAKQLDTVADDISSNPSKDSAANRAVVAAHSTADFRVEPIMARHHRIDFQVPSNQTANWATAAARQVSFASARRTVNVPTSKADIDLLVRSVVPEHDGGAQNQVRLSDNRLLSPSDRSSEPGVTVSHSGKSDQAPPETSSSFWQNAVDLLMAGATGAMIYSHRNEAEKRPHFSLG